MYLRVPDAGICCRLEKGAHAQKLGFLGEHCDGGRVEGKEFFCSSLRCYIEAGLDIEVGRHRPVGGFSKFPFQLVGCCRLQGKVVETHTSNFIGLQVARGKTERPRCNTPCTFGIAGSSTWWEEENDVHIPQELDY